MFYVSKTLTITWQDCIDTLIDLCTLKILTLNAKNEGACWKFICCAILICFSRYVHALHITVGKLTTIILYDLISK